MAHHASSVLALLLLVALALFVSTGNGAVNFGYPNKCFFTVGKSAAGAWWFVDPLGKPFLSLGVTSVSYWGDTSTTGATPYYSAVSAKFNNNQSAWADSAVERMASWKLNTLGAWADTVVITKGMPYTRILGFGEGFGSWLKGLFPDVFDPAWEASTLTKAKAICEPLRNDPNLIGYFLDNELMWGKMLQGWDDWRFAGTLLDQFLVEFNKTAPGNIKAVNFLKGKYSTVKALNTAWGTNYTSFSDINARPSVETSAHTNDSAAFTYMTAVQFFNVSRNSIRKYDANHMLLGVKFAGAPSAPVIKACGEYNEVVSLDYYPSDSEPLPNTNFFSQVYAAAKKPLLVGEFAYRGDDAGLPNTKGAGLRVATQALRAEGYKNYTTILAKLPYVIGFHWFEWFDEPAEGRSLDGENSNYGLVNINDVTYAALTNQMKITNPQLYTIHETGQPTGLSSAKCLSSLSCLNKCSGHGCCNSNTGNCNCNTGFSGVDCSVDSSKLQITSFGSSVNTSTWTVSNDGGWNSQAFSSGQVTTVNNQLRLAISPCTASPCSGKNFTSGGVTTISNSYGFGIYTAQIQATQRAGFSVQLELNSKSDPRESITLHVNGNESIASLDYYGNSQYQYLKWVSPLSYANPSAAFHNYSIHYMPTYFAFYADSVLLGYYNSSSVLYGLPSRPMAVWLYVTASTTSPKVSDAAYVKSVTYKLVGGTTATCPSSANTDVSAASRSLPSLISPLVSIFAS